MNSSEGKRSIWKNLQLPLHALARSTDFESTPLPAYIHLGQTEENVKLSIWDSFSHEDLESAKACMDWITTRLSDRAFWPPAEKVEYDDFALLAQNSPLGEAFAEFEPKSKIKNHQSSIGIHESPIGIQNAAPVGKN